MRSAIVALALLGACAASLVAGVNLCEQHHGFAGEASANFTLTAATWTLTGNQKYVLYARSLSSEGSVQLNIAGRMFPADEPVIIESLPPPPVQILVVPKTTDVSPFTFVSYVANSEDCRLPLSEGNLAVPLPVIDGQPATVYFLAAPVYPYRYFSIQITSPQPVTAVYRYDLQTPLDRAIPIPTNTPIGGLAENVNTGVYVAAKAASPAGVDIARMSVTWSVPPPNWQPPSPPKEGGSWRDTAKRAARESGGFFGGFIVTLFFGFIAYMVLRSLYNYHHLHITTFPQYMPHHEFFQGAASKANEGIDNIRGRVNAHSGNFGPPSASVPSFGGNSRRGYETVGGGTQP